MLPELPPCGDVLLGDWLPVLLPLELPEFGELEDPLLEEPLLFGEVEFGLVELGEFGLLPFCWSLWLELEPDASGVLELEPEFGLVVLGLVWLGLWLGLVVSGVWLGLCELLELDWFCPAVLLLLDEPVDDPLCDEDWARTQEPHSRTTANKLTFPNFICEGLRRFKSREASVRA